MSEGSKQLGLLRASCAQLQSALILNPDPIDDLRPYLRMSLSPDKYSEVLQANSPLAWVFDDVKFFGPECLAYRAN